jgi:hypothetical protein
MKKKMKRRRKKMKNQITDEKQMLNYGSITMLIKNKEIHNNNMWSE